MSVEKKKYINVPKFVKLVPELFIENKVLQTLPYYIILNKMLVINKLI